MCYLRRERVNRYDNISLRFSEASEFGELQLFELFCVNLGCICSWYKHSDICNRLIYSTTPYQVTRKESLTHNACMCNTLGNYKLLQECYIFKQLILHLFFKTK